MMDAAQVSWRAIRHVNHRGYIYIWANVLWFMLSLPIITAPAAWAGLVKMSRRAQTSPSANLNDFWEGFKENLGRGAGLMALNVVVIAINVINLAAYQNRAEPLFFVLRGMWIAALVVWMMVQFYLWPVFYEMKSPSLLGAMRNAGVMILLNPLFTIGIGIAALLIVSLSTALLPAWFLLAGGVLAAMATEAVRDRLTTAGHYPQPPEAPPVETDDLDLMG